jgi:hypothetical protein
VVRTSRFGLGSSTPGSQPFGMSVTRQPATVSRTVSIGVSTNGVACGTLRSSVSRACSADAPSSTSASAVACRNGSPGEPVETITATRGWLRMAANVRPRCSRTRYRV